MSVIKGDVPQDSVPEQCASVSPVRVGSKLAMSQQIIGTCERQIPPIGCRRPSVIVVHPAGA
jgi:hypothetical protein